MDYDTSDTGELWEAEYVGTTRLEGWVKVRTVPASPKPRQPSSTNLRLLSQPLAELRGEG